MSAATPPIDLTEPRHSGELILLAVDLFRRHALVFYGLTLAVVVPVTVVVEGLWGGLLDRETEHAGTVLLALIPVEPLAVAAAALAQALVLSLTALFGTLLYFSMRPERV